MRLLTAVVFVVLSSGCTSTSFQDFGAKIDGALQKDDSPQPVTQSTPEKKETFGLTIDAIPSDSTVKIMNIKPKYHDGIQLRSGVYDIWVLREGYISYRKNISISGRDVEKQIVLQKQHSTEQAVATEKPSSPVQKPTNKTQATEKPKTTKAKKPIAKTAKKKKAKPLPKESKKKQIAKTQDMVNDNSTDPRVLPATLSTPSKLKAVQVDKNQIPVFDGGYLKVLEKGFFSDDSQFVEVPPNTVYKAKIYYTASSSVSITWLMNMDYRFFTLDADNAISIPLESFQGFVAKGSHYDDVSLHHAERIVMGYNKQGGKTGKTASLVQSQTAVFTGEDIYSYTQHASLDMKKTKLGEDSYFYMLREPVQKGLYFAWYGGKFRFFNLL